MLSWRSATALAAGAFKAENPCPRVQAGEAKRVTERKRGLFGWLGNLFRFGKKVQPDQAWKTADGETAGNAERLQKTERATKVERVERPSRPERPERPERGPNR